MGHSFKANCSDCQLDFDANEGGGFFFHLLRCDRCGEVKCIGFDEIAESRLPYLKVLPGPNCVVSADADEIVSESYPGEPLAEEDDHQTVERLAGKCPCEGQFRFAAPIRCPRCRSTRIEHGGVHTFYD
jgi:hypothetical protein